MAKTIVVKQVGSPIRRPADQRATLIGLGLNKMNRTRELGRWPSVLRHYRTRRIGRPISLL